MNIDEMVSYCSIYFKHHKYTDFNKYNLEKYSFWSSKIKYITNVYEPLTIRKIFNIMVFSKQFKKIKIKKSTFYIFDPFNMYETHTQKKIYHVNWN